MHAPRTSPSSADVAMEVTTLSAGLGILVLPLFPFALPGLVLVVGPLVPVAIVGVLLALPLVLPIWLVRAVRRRRYHRRLATVSRAKRAPAAANARP
jgi:hypothetical protein